MIEIIQGTPGSGKSAVATVAMLETLLAGGVVACNYDLVPGWHYALADLNLKVRLGLKDRETVAQGYWDRAFKIGTHDTVYELSERLKGLPGVRFNKKGRPAEGSGKLYIDEAQLLFNSRDWQNNKGFIEFFTQHRKLGWDVVLIAHTEDMIDKQIRGLIEYETRLRNLKNIKIAGVMPVWPYPAFFAITRYAGISAGAGEIAWRRLYKLRPEFADLYDSMEVFAFNASGESVEKQGPSHFVKKEPLRLSAPAPASSWPQYYYQVGPATCPAEAAG